MLTPKQARDVCAALEEKPMTGIYVVICPERRDASGNLDNCEEHEATQFCVSLENATVVHETPTRAQALDWVRTNYPEAVDCDGVALFGA